MISRFLGKTLTNNPQHNTLNGGRQEGARYAIIILTSINLLNYADRYVPASVKDLIKEDLNLTDVETSLPATGMVNSLNQIIN